MRCEFQRTTLRGVATLIGVGIHSGLPSSATIRPSDSGISFNGVAAHPANVTETSRSTSLGSVRMVEHLMSAFSALGVTDASVEVDSEEMPILDGGSLSYYKAVRDAGAEDLGQTRCCKIFGRVNLQDGPQRIGISLGSGRWRYEFEREGCWPGLQVFEAQADEEYETQIAPARTFAFEDEIEMLQNAGLGRGGTEENTLVIGPQGYLTANRFQDEPARHKLLDCIGDLYLSGIPPRFLNVVAERTGHKMNVEAAARLVEVCGWEE